MPESVRAYVALGSNIDPERNVLRALENLAKRARLCALSTLYWTAALDRPADPPFVNGACALETTLAPRALKFDLLRGIEAELGRVRAVDRYAPRTIDLDVVAYGAAAIDEPDLRVPDPDLRARPFLAVPLWELAPDLTLADTGEALAKIIENMSREGMRADEALTRRIREKLGL